MVDLLAHQTAALLVLCVFQILETIFPAVHQKTPYVEVNHETGLEVESAVLTYHLKDQGVPSVHQSGLEVDP